MNNLFLALNIIGIASYLSLLPVHVDLHVEDKENGKTGFFKRGRFSTGIFIIYLVFLSKAFGWDGFFGFADIGIFFQIPWLIYNSRSELWQVTHKYGSFSGLKLAAYNLIGISTLLFQIFNFFNK